MPEGVDIPLPASVEITFPVKRQGREGPPVNAALVGYCVLILHSVLSAPDLCKRFTASTWGPLHQAHSWGKRKVNNTNTTEETTTSSQNVDFFFFLTCS